jgi:hypothetical protein
MVGEGEGLHPQIGGAIHQSVDAASPIQEAIVAMDVKMNEILVDGTHG